MLKKLKRTFATEFETFKLLETGKHKYKCSPLCCGFNSDIQSHAQNPVKHLR